MKIKIDIDCDNAFQVLQHLFVIKRDFKKHLRKQGIKTYDDLMNHEPEKGFSLYDNNCYGTHNVKVKPH